jgi:hypothetical protein
MSKNFDAVLLAAALVLTKAAQTAHDAALDAYRHDVGTYTDLANAIFRFKALVCTLD